MRKIKDRTGNKIGMLTAISYEYSKLLKDGKTNRAYWKFKCDCGKEVVKEGNIFINKKAARSCGCINHKFGIENSGWKGHDIITGSYIASIKNRNVCKLGFDIDAEYIYNLLVEQNFKCKISNVNIIRSGNSNKVKNKIEETASLDRINSSLGYIKGNVQWLHKRVNVMKMNMSDKELIEWCKIISNNN